MDTLQNFTKRIFDKNSESPLITFNPLKMTKAWGFQLFSRLAHRNCLICGTKVNLDNTYTLEILKLFEKFLIPSNPP